MTSVQTLVDSHTRAELDQIATEAGVEDPESMGNKEDVAQAIVEAEGRKPADEDAPASPPPAISGLPEGWTAVQTGPDYFTAERYVESLGIQKVSEGAASEQELVAACEAYDAYQLTVDEAVDHPYAGSTIGTVVEGQADTETAAA